MRFDYNDDDDSTANQTALRQFPALSSTIDIHRVASYGELIQIPELNVRAADAIAYELESGAEFVAWIPKWLIDSKQIASSDHHSVQRALFENRKEKRISAITPDVDAADPFGALMPSISVVGPGVSALESRVEAAFEDLEPHEDAPELAVRVPIDDRTHSRQACADATREMCRAKGLRPTREAISVLQALCGSPYDVAEALQALGKETKDPGRPIRAHDLRYALSTLSPKRLLPDLPIDCG